MNSSIAYQIFFSSQTHLLFAMSCLAEQLRTEQPISKVIARLDPYQSIPTEVISQVEVISTYPRDDRLSWLGTLAEQATAAATESPCAA